MTRRLLAVASILTVLAACSDNPPDNQLVVASRNLYLGGDIFSVVTAPDATAAAIAVHEVWTSVQATNFPARATAIANELAAIQPDVVGLQEASIWRTGLPRVCATDGSGLQYINAPVASTVVYDYVDLLVAALKAKGLDYVVARATQSFDAEFCSLDPADPTPPIDVRWTDREVILVRSGLSTQNAGGGIYGVYVPFEIPGTGVVVPDVRGWSTVEVQKGGQWFRVFETHLEIQELPGLPPEIPPFYFQLAQAGELVGVHVASAQAASPLPTIVVGDFNSQAEQYVTSPLRTTYNYLAGYISFPDLQTPALAPLTGTKSPLTDAWIASGGSATGGLTWGFSDDLTSGTPSQRIDFALTWNATPVSTMTTFGGTDLTPTSPPLHSSDHLGIVVKIAP
jgi:endonuclease/exonuclease/phosphatase family metal-dependent hydrolase